MVPIRDISQYANHPEFAQYLYVGRFAYLTGIMIFLLLFEAFGISYLWAYLVAVSVGLLMSPLLCVKSVFLYCRYNRVVFDPPLFV